MNKENVLPTSCSTLIDKVVSHGALAAERRVLERHVLFRLRIKRWILNETVDEEPHCCVFESEGDDSQRQTSRNAQTQPTTTYCDF